MARRRPFLVAALLIAGPLAEARRAGEEDPAIIAERDVLLAKIAGGEEYEANVRRFVALVARRDQAIATSVAAKSQAERDRREEDRLARAWRDSVESSVASRCILSPDPRAPILPVGKHDHPADWGKVTRKLVVTLPPRNALDDEKRTVTVYEVEGQARRYVFHSPRHDEEKARQGDQVLLCVQPNTWSHNEPVILAHGVDSLPRLGEGQSYPAEWKGLVVHVSLLARIARPPRIVDKAKLRPLHVEDREISHAIRSVKWRWPPDQRVLVTFKVLRDLGGGRFEIAGDGDKTWILEVPATLPRREVLLPHHHVWGILGKARFDAELKKLVVEAVDVEEHYLVEP